MYLSPRTLRIACLVPLLALFAACVPPGASSGGAASPSKPEPGKASAESLKKLAEIADTNAKQCEEKTDDTYKKLSAAIDKLQGGKPDASGKPAPSMGDALAKLRKEKVTATVDVLGSPEMPMLMVKDSMMAEGQTLQGAPQAKLMAYAKRMTVVQPSLSTLRESVQAVNTTLGAGFQSTISCNGFAQGLTTTLGALDNGDNDPSPELMAAYRRMLQANARSKTVVAASIAMVGVIEAGLAGKDPKSFDTLLDGLKKTNQTPEEVTEQQAKQAYKAAGQGLFDACHEQMEKSYRDHPELKRPDVDPCSKEGARVKGSPSEEKARSEKLAEAGAAAGGSGDLVDEAVRRLVPRNTPLADASDALLALKNGDYLGALKGAAKLAGKVTPFGGVVSSVLGLFG